MAGSKNAEVVVRDSPERDCMYVLLESDDGPVNWVSSKQLASRFESVEVAYEVCGRFLPGKTLIFETVHFQDRSYLSLIR